MSGWRTARGSTTWTGVSELTNWCASASRTHCCSKGPSSISIIISKPEKGVVLASAHNRPGGLQVWQVLRVFHVQTMLKGRQHQQHMGDVIWRYWGREDCTTRDTVLITGQQQHGTYLFNMQSLGGKRQRQLIFPLRISLRICRRPSICSHPLLLRQPQTTGSLALSPPVTVSCGGE